MLRRVLTLAPPVALVLVGVLLVEPPYLTPADRVPTLRLLTADAEPSLMPRMTLRTALSRLLGPTPRGEDRVGRLDVRSDVLVVEWWLHEPESPSRPRIDPRDDVYALLRWARLVVTASPDDAPRWFTFIGRRPGTGSEIGPADRRLELTYSVEQVTGLDWGTLRSADVYALAESAIIPPPIR